MSRTLPDGSDTAPRIGGATRSPEGMEGLLQPKPMEPGSFRARVHSTPAIALAWRGGVFVAGLLFIVLGLVLTVLPGPLTIPPVLIGLWVWSTEFRWARRIFVGFKRKARATWQHAKQHPVSSAAITIGGLAAAALAIWAVGHFDLVDRGKSALGF